MKRLDQFTPDSGWGSVPTSLSPSVAAADPSASTTATTTTAATNEQQRQATASVFVPPPIASDFPGATTNGFFWLNQMWRRSGQNIANPTSDLENLIAGAVDGGATLRQAQDLVNEAALFDPATLVLGLQERVRTLEQLIHELLPVPVNRRDIETAALEAMMALGSPGVPSGGTTGSGYYVLQTGPTLVAPTLGAATATSINKVSFTQPATSATLTLADGSTLATSGAFSLTFTSGANASYTMNNATGTRLESCAFSGVSTVTISNAGPTSVFGTGSAGSSLTIPSAFWVAGAQIIIEVEGTFSTGSTGPTLAMAVTLGGTTMASMSATGLSLSIVTKPFKARATLTCRTPGASASFACHLEFQGYTTATTVNSNAADSTSGAPNTTGSLALDMTATTAASAGTTTLTITQQRVILSGV